MLCGYDISAVRTERYLIAGRFLGIVATTLVVWTCSVILSRSLTLHLDHGVTHFDLANNYGPAYGSAEENFGRILKKGLGAYRDEMIISTKAGYDMWPGPYGNWGSRKYLMASLDQSLKRMGLEYVDIFYSHRPDPETRSRRRWGPWLISSGKERLCM